MCVCISGRKMCVKRKKKSMTALGVCIRLAQWKWISICRAYFLLFYLFVSLLRCHSSVRVRVRVFVSMPLIHSWNFIKNCARKRKNKTQEKHHHKIVWLLLLLSHLSIRSDVHATHLAFNVLHICENEILSLIEANERTCNWIHTWFNESISEWMWSWEQYQIAFMQSLSDECKRLSENWKSQIGISGVKVVFISHLTVQKGIVRQTLLIQSIKCPLLFSSMTVAPCSWCRTAHVHEKKTVC